MNTKFDKVGVVEFVDEDEQQENSLNITQTSSAHNMELQNLTTPRQSRNNKKIDHENQLYPFCIVWTALPMISTLCPFIGHTGIAGYFSFIL